MPPARRPSATFLWTSLVVLAQLNYFGYDFYGSSITDLGVRSVWRRQGTHPRDPTASFLAV